MEKVEFTTTDGVFIVGDYYAPDTPGERGILLLHMMPSDRKSWRAFAEKLRGTGCHVLAIDLRGHGESTRQEERTLDYKRFYSDEEHKASRLDVDAAVDFLSEKGVREEQLVICGASIGANLALAYMAAHPAVPCVVLLSPGLVYRGIQTDEAMRVLSKRNSVLLLASEEDSYSVESVRELEKIGEAQRDVMVYQELGHGTTMFEKDPAVMETVMQWILTHVPPTADTPPKS